MSNSNSAEIYTEADQGRAQVQWCYSERGGASGSVFETFSGNGKKKIEPFKPNPKIRKKIKNLTGRTDADGRPIENIPLGAGFNATRVSASESRRHQGSKVPIASGRCGGDIMRAISSLNPIQQAWVNYCYNPTYSVKAESGMTYGQLLLANFRGRHDLKGLHTRTLVTITFLLRLQAVSGSSYHTFVQWQPGCPAEFKSTISRSMWSRTYSDYWKSVREMMISTDTKAMEEVHRMSLKNNI